MGNNTCCMNKDFYEKYNQNGDLLYRVSLVNGKKHGNQKNYNKKKRLDSIVQYCHGKMHGNFIIFKKNGMDVKMKTNFCNNKKHGFEFHYHETGNFLILFNIYRYGKLVYSNKFSQTSMNECCVCFENTNFHSICKHTICPQCYDNVESCPVCRRFFYERIILH